MPKAVEHGSKLFFVPREMEDRVTNHYIGKFAWERHFLDETHFEIFRQHPDSEGCIEFENILNSLGVSVHCKILAAFEKKIYKVFAIAAAGVEHAHPLVDI